jgi:TrmH family RNA methyltransferase
MAGESIRSRDNPLLRLIRRVRADGGREQGLALLEGPKLVTEARAAGVQILELVASPRGAERAGPLLEALSATATRVRRVDEPLLAALSEAETSQGLLGLARRPRFDERRLFDGLPLVVVAVAMQNPGNLGALLRTAEAAGATGAVLTQGCADPFSWKALRGAMGSAFRLPHVAGLSLPAAIERLRARGLAIAGTVAAGGTPYHAAGLGRPLALLFGNEAAGLPDALLQSVGLRLTVPLAEPVESLNVAVAAGVLLFEAARQRRALASS